MVHVWDITEEDCKGHEDSTDTGTIVNHSEQLGTLAANTNIIRFSIENGKLYTTSR